ncbi:hypothetical protein EMCRGX_G011063 [Ephydatia muelleri]|eukprot:Em0006g1248a
MPKVKIHYTLEGQTKVVATLSANVAKLEFIKRGLPGQPAGYEITRMEGSDGTELTDLSAPPPETVYVTGVIKNK